MVERVDLEPARRQSGMKHGASAHEEAMIRRMHRQGEAAGNISQTLNITTACVNSVIEFYTENKEKYDLKEVLGVAQQVGGEPSVEEVFGDK